MNPDILNAAFEFAGVLFMMLSIRKLYLEKKVAGVSLIHIGFFCLWGYWNLIYYPLIGQWWSTAAAAALVTAQTFWLGQLIYYSKKGKAV